MVPKADLRVAPLSDVHAADVARIQQECYGVAHIETAQSLAAKWRASPGTCFIAEAGRGVVAYLVAVPVRYPALPAWNAPSIEVPADADALYLHDLAVSRQARGWGAGRTLVEAALQRARADGYPQACLVAVQDSTAFWQGFGFEVVLPPTSQVEAKLATFGASARLMTVRW